MFRMKGKATDEELLSRRQQEAERAKKIILWVMAVFIILPPLLAWLTGAIRL